MVSCPSCRSEVVPGSRFCGVCGTALAAPSPYAPYGVLPPKKNNTALIIVIVVVFVVVVPTVAAAILYIMVSGLITPPPANVHPVMTLTLSSATATQATILVAGSQPAPAPSNLKVNLAAGSDFGTAVNLPSVSDAPVDITVSGYMSPFTVRWVDVGGDGVVSGGDEFVVTYSTGLSTGTTLQFYVLWYDGAVLTTLAWST